MRSRKLAVILLVAFAASGWADRQILGKIESIMDQSATIDVGKQDGVEENMVFEVWSNPRMIEIPISGDVVFQEMKVVASIVVVDVADTHSTCRIENFEMAASQVKAGMRVAQNPVRPEEEQDPYVVEFLADNAAAAWNNSIKLNIKASDPNGGRLIYRWSCTGGRLAFAATSSPENTWTAPLESGQYEVTVVVRDPTGREGTDTKVLRSGGLPRNWRPQRFPFRGHLGDHQVIFSKIADIAFDQQGFAYVLDPERRMVVKLDEGWGYVAQYGPYPDDFDFFRMEVFENRVYLLDRYNKAVFMYPLNSAETFTTNRPVKFGKEGSYGVNGEMVDPIDIEINSQGEVYVLDKHTGTVQLFDKLGNFQLSLGTKANGNMDGQLEQPVSIALDPEGNLIVLDDGQIKKVVVFENHRPAFQIRLGDAKEKMTGLDFDPTTGLMYVLSNTGGDVNLRPIKALECRKQRSNVRKFGEMLTESKSFKNMTDVSRIKLSPTGDVFVVAKQNTELFRYISTDEQTWQLYGKWGGEAYSFEYVTKISCDPLGNIACLAPDLYAVMVLDNVGWMTAKFGHIGEGNDRLRDPIDIDSGADGSIYVLDAEYGNVRKYSPNGGIPVPIGNPGAGGSQISNPVDVAVVEGTVYVLMAREVNAILHFDEAGRVIDSFPAAADSQLTEPSALGALPKDRVVAGCNDNYVLRRYLKRQGRFSADQSFKLFTDVNAYDDLSGMNTGLLGMVARDDGAFGDDFYVAVADENVGLIGRVDDDMENNCPAPVDLATDGYGMMYVLDAQSHRIARFQCQ